ncbi:hypothetical protein [Cupriavidus sp. YR651]|uniref:hypothetical protein n=1 Tax=Cupriavidus sp. YR651 TaxID=1855315 RepID=UPI00115F99AA|nr:hypothetical protein [Cupriavidus sp. YR651]
MHESSRIHARHGQARACAAPHRQRTPSRDAWPQPATSRRPHRHQRADDRRTGRPAIPVLCRRVVAHRAWMNF